jgi:glycosyltransferase involved in cell wall biosynthesis
VPPDDVEALAAKIQELTASEGLRRRLGRGAAALAQDFSWEKIAKRTAEVYEEVSGSRLSG